MTTLPEVNGSSVVVTAPFMVSEGSFFRPGDAASWPLHGGGLATLTLTANPSLPVWEFSHLRYDFQTTAPVPEPATLVLVGGGLVGVLRVRKRRPRISESS